MFPHQPPVVLPIVSICIWFYVMFSRSANYSLRCCLAFNWIPFFSFNQPNVPDFGLQGETGTPKTFLTLSDPGRCQVGLLVLLCYSKVQKCTGKCARQDQQRQRENATLKRFNLDYYNSLRVRSHATSVITTNRCISRRVRVPDLIWSCWPCILTPLITTDKQQHFSGAGMFGPQTEEKHQFLGFTVKTHLKEENYGLQM